jgi:hypothetical protein
VSTEPGAAQFPLFQIDDDNGMKASDHVISGELSHICRAEVVTDGPLVNDLSLPIVPGDVFAEIERAGLLKSRMKSGRASSR